MSNNKLLIDLQGNPLRMSAGGYTGGHRRRDMASFNPPLRSADADLLPDLKSLNARSNDLMRNYGQIQGGAQIHLDNIIGSQLTLSYKPDYLELGMDAEWAMEFSEYVKRKWRNHAYSASNYIDATRHNNFSGLIGLGYRQFLGAGEILSVPRWLPNRGSKYASAIKMVDPSRLSNPNDGLDSSRLRAGVRLGREEDAIGYWIRKALSSDMMLNGSDVYEWEYIPRETRWGRQLVIHVFEQERASQSRGKTGLAAMIKNAFKLEKFQDISMDRAIVDAMYAATIETDYNFSQAAELLGSDAEAIELADDIMDGKEEFHGDVGVKVNGVKVPHLYAGERLSFSTPQAGGPNFEQFEASFLRNMAATYNLTYEQLSRDYTKTNYSGARAGLMEAQKFFKSRRVKIISPFATAIFSLWLEEAIDIGAIKLPSNAPSFNAEKDAYTRCRWIGPAEGNEIGRAHV